MSRPGASLTLHPATDVAAAVTQADEMKRLGTHDVFRGQTKNLTLQSSLNRDPQRREASVARAKTFLSWVQRTRGLESLWDDADAAVAVAQHYGILTNFIDFTTEPGVAGYFASEGAPHADPATFDFAREERRFFASEPATDDVGAALI